MIDLFDQTVRNYTVGLMADFIFKEKRKNEDPVLKRSGSEVKKLRKQLFKYRRDEFDRKVLK